MTEQFFQLLNSGGQVSLLAACYFIWKASERLARIEKALDRYMRENGNGNHKASQATAPLP